MVARKGWFIIPGVQDGDRTFEEQVWALRPALEEAQGKRVLDLGCAEGLISRAFAQAGAEYVFGLDSVEGHLEVARSLCNGMENIAFGFANLNHYADRPLPNPFDTVRYDIVIACGVLHKLKFPDVAVGIATRACQGLLLTRGVRGGDTVIRSKHWPDHSCDYHALLRRFGFTLEKVVRGHVERPEDAEYWRAPCKA